eukprot:gene341-491_t
MAPAPPEPAGRDAPQREVRFARASRPVWASRQPVAAGRPERRRSPAGASAASASALLGKPLSEKVQWASEPKPAPDHTFFDSAGKPMKVADLKGKVVVLNIWATWCAPCVAEMPTLDKAAASMTIVAVGCGSASRIGISECMDKAATIRIGVAVDQEDIAHAQRLTAPPFIIAIGRSTDHRDGRRRRSPARFACVAGGRAAPIFRCEIERQGAGHFLGEFSATYWRAPLFRKAGKNGAESRGERGSQQGGNRPFGEVRGSCRRCERAGTRRHSTRARKSEHAAMPESLNHHERSVQRLFQRSFTPF